MAELLFAHILFAVLLFASLGARLITILKGKNFASLRVAAYGLTAGQILTGLGLIFAGASFARVCAAGLVLIGVVILSDFALNRLNRGVAYDIKNSK